jgi:hypothetical protein
MLVEDIGHLQGWPSHGCTSGRRQRLQWADHLAQQIGGHVGVDRRRLQALVAQQHLDHADVHLALQQVGCESVAQRVRGNALVDTGSIGSRVYGAVELARRQRVSRVQAREQPATGPHAALGVGNAPPGAQALQQHRAEHGVAVLAALALLHPQRHALAVHVGHLQTDDLAGAQAGAVGH